MIKTPMRLLYTIIKNLKIIFRNWSSVVMLIIGPMLLILIVGYAFSGDALHDIKIGIYAKDYNAVKPIIQKLQSEDVSIARYYSTDLCILAMKMGNVHLCAEFSDEFYIPQKARELPNGTIIFYHDNSRTNLVKHVIAYVEKKIDITAQEITLESTRAILSDIENAVVFMLSAQESIKDFIADAKQTKKDLEDSKTKLEKIKADFDPRYKRIKELQAIINDDVNKTNQTKNELEENINNLTAEIDNLKQQVNDFKAKYTLDDYIKKFNSNITALNTNIPAINSSDLLLLTIYDTSFNAILSTLDKIEQELKKLKNIGNENYNNTLEYVNEFNLIVAELDFINQTLSETIVKIDDNIARIDTTIIQLQQVSAQLDKNIQQFSGLSQAQADILLKPITSEFKALLPDATKIQLIFPVLLIFIITFISILLSNMVVLNEIHTPANFRNLLLPVNNMIFILGLFITNIIVVSIQIIVFLLVAYTRFNVQILPVIKPLAISILLVMTLFILIGMIFGYLIRTKESSILASTFFALTIFLFSDVIFPLEAMPKIASYIAQFNPLVMGEAMFRKILFFNLSLKQQMFDIVVLLAIIIVLFIIAIIAYYKNRKRL